MKKLFLIFFCVLIFSFLSCEKEKKTIIGNHVITTDATVLYEKPGAYGTIKTGKEKSYTVEEIKKSNSEYYFRISYEKKGKNRKAFLKSSEVYIPYEEIEKYVTDTVNAEPYLDSLIANLSYTFYDLRYSNYSENKGSFFYEIVKQCHEQKKNDGEINLLLKKIIDLDSYYYFGRAKNPITLMVEYDYVQCFTDWKKYFLDSIDDQFEPDQETLLMIAVKNKSLACVESLRKEEKNLSLRNKDGKTVADFARESGDSTLIAFFCQTTNQNVFSESLKKMNDKELAQLKKEKTAVSALRYVTKLLDEGEFKPFYAYVCLDEGNSIPLYSSPVRQTDYDKNSGESNITLYDGEKVTVIEPNEETVFDYGIKSSWLHIRNSSGNEGYLFSGFLECFVTDADFESDRISQLYDWEFDENAFDKYCFAICDTKMNDSDSREIELKTGERLEVISKFQNENDLIINRIRYPDFLVRKSDGQTGVINSCKLGQYFLDEYEEFHSNFKCVWMQTRKRQEEDIHRLENITVFSNSGYNKSVNIRSSLKKEKVVLAFCVDEFTDEKSNKRYTVPVFSIYPEHGGGYALGCTLDDKGELHTFVTYDYSYYDNWENPQNNYMYGKHLTYNLTRLHKFYYSDIGYENGDRDPNWPESEIWNYGPSEKNPYIYKLTEHEPYQVPEW